MNTSSLKVSAIRKFVLGEGRKSRPLGNDL
jgi:hypothetical protein